MNTQTSYSGPPRGARFVAWLNIAVQAALPLTLALSTPSATAAPEGDASAQSFNYTQVHTFVMGDTLLSVATKYATNVATLRTLNPSLDLDKLQPGDPLHVPMASTQVLPELNTAGKDAKTTAEAEDEQARKLAGLASDTGSFLTSNPNGDTATSMARGMATSEASGQAQQWLSRFGTARVQIDVDEKLSLKNSQVELLAPLYDTPEHLLFTQGSLHRKDDRQQTSLGLGVRRFNDGYMLGANSFLDHDLSRGHSRLGLGLEYWRDFLKVNANSYLRLTSWKDSPDVEDYQERPANGWDVRTEAWLPSMPQLGGKLTYEQYYGDEVGLFGKDNRKKDPSAVTVGLTYTPIPLLTLSADQRKGNGGDETTFGAQFSYRLGEPWAKQVDPAGVGAMRSLAGSRYDLVERNNHIVLEYRKKQVIQMAAAANVSGQAGETKSLSVWVNSKHPLSHIDWTAPALLQAGGQLVHDGGPNYSVVLPEYFSNGQRNAYTLHGVAVDSKGNRSGRSETQVTVNAPALSTRHSTFTPLDNVLPADGKSQVTLTLAVRDEQQQPVDIALADIQIAVKQTRAAGLVVSDPTRASAGVYEVLVTAGTTEQSVTLTPSIQGTVLPEARVTATNIMPSPGKSAFSASPALIKADDKQIATLTFSAKDENDLPLEGIADKLKFVATGSKGTVSPPDVTVGTVTERVKGSYTATLKGTLADTYTLTPHFGGTAVGRLSAQVELQALPPLEANSKFEAKPPTVAANDSDTITLTFTAKDANDKPVSGIADSLVFTLSDKNGQEPAPGDITLGTLQENGTTGIYTAPLHGRQAGVFTLTPKVGSEVMHRLATDVTLTALPPAAEKSTIGVTKASILADDVDETIVRFSVADALGRPIQGIEKQIALLVKDSNGQPVPSVRLSAISEHYSPGIYSATLAGSKEGSFHITPQINGSDLGTLSTSIQLLTTEIIALSATTNPSVYKHAVNRGFPTTAFENGGFYPVLANSAYRGDYIWTSSVSWLTPDARNIYVFSTPPAGASGVITITGTRKGSSVSHSYSFKINRWYVTSDSTTTWSRAMDVCLAQGLSPVSKAEATKGERVVDVGSVSSEWGAVGGGNVTNSLWLSDSTGGGNYLWLSIKLGEGSVPPVGGVESVPGTIGTGKPFCRRDL